ncbi:MAG: hypothetical protein A2060_07865 [Planctomycetes bacterium GWA2_50_13]|nr:MAG: hypothetical protein A2060_07865 [Planctomycetes bacterium GWA2_50_13]OHB96164.1 MAG: hypothetical protein A3I59_04690 [Planctomycetes bacterium RIFCSPLOWO2_02_FULL_50_16]OHC04708.1 MAG: hypothetical protein A3G17_03965 [Planctomycetes bacterium RIFCSPLOWO2_12_FULL_50_35]HCN19165.1 hypothetical protein [Planctomycetia bacterium]
MVFSEDYTRALRISNEGNIQTAIVKPTISIKSFDIKDRKDHPQFDQQKFPYLYGLHFSFDVINGIEHKRDLVLTRVIAKLYCNNEADILNQAFDYNERIEMSSSKNIATIDGLFIGHPRKIENCKLQIICKFKNYPDVISQKVDALILKYKNDR